MYKRLISPIKVQIELTEHCNNRCQHCYNFWRQDNQAKFSLSWSQLKNVITKLSFSNVLGIVLTGGEPLLMPQKTISAIKLAKSHGLTVSLNSNLTLLDQKLSKELSSSGLNHVLTSVLGPNADMHDKITGKRGSFDSVIAGLRHAIHSGLSVTCNMVVSKINANCVLSTAQLLSNLGVKSFCVTRAGCPGNCTDFSNLALSNDELMRMLSDLMECEKQFNLRIDTLEPIPACALNQRELKKFLKRRCYAGVTTCTISASGEVRPCSHIPVSYGNILNEDLGNIWGKIQSDWAEGRYLPTECVSCQLFDICGGGCRMTATKNGKMNIGGVDAYACVDRVDEVSNILGKLKAERAKQSICESFVLDERVLSRTESFGAIVVSPHESTLFLNSEGYNVFKQLSTGNTYQRFDRRIDWGNINQDEFLSVLLEEGVINTQK